MPLRKPATSGQRRGWREGQAWGSSQSQGEGQESHLGEHLLEASLVDADDGVAVLRAEDLSQLAHGDHPVRVHVEEGEHRELEQLRIVAFDGQLRKQRPRPRARAGGERRERPRLRARAVVSAGAQGEGADESAGEVLGVGEGLGAGEGARHTSSCRATR
jgi:hypothetical protein